MTDISIADARLMLARSQFHAFNEIGLGIALPRERRRRLLAMSAQEWSAWETFATNGGTPPSMTSLPDVLLRLANASYRLATRVNRASRLH
jgi:hypothetical protein